MAEMDEQILEGMYMGIEEKIESIAETVGQQLLFTTEQLESSLKGSIDSMLEEVRYITQQNSAIYDLSKADITALKDDIDKSTAEKIEVALGGLKAQIEELQQKLAGLSAGSSEPSESAINAAVADQSGKIDEAVDKLNARLQLEVNALRGELMDAIAKIPTSVSSSEEKPQVVHDDKLGEAVNTLGVKLENQSKEVGALKDELLGAMAQLSVASASGTGEAPQIVNNDKLEIAVETLGVKLEKQALEMGVLKDELLDAMAQLSLAGVSSTGEKPQIVRDAKLEEAVDSLSVKMDKQAREVGGLRDELLEAMAQIGMAVATPRDSSSDFMALKAELTKSKDATDASEREYLHQFDRAVDTMNSRMQLEIDKLRADLLNAISDIPKEPAEPVQKKKAAASDVDTEKLSAAVESLNESLDTKVAVLKDELLGAIAQVGMAVFNAPDHKDDFISLREDIAKNQGANEAAEREHSIQLERAIDDLNNTVLQEIAALKAEMREKIANVKTDDGASKSKKDSAQASDEYAEKLEEAVDALNKKIESQSREVGGLKDELLEAMAQIGMAVTTVPDSRSGLTALREEIARKQDESAAVERERSIQLERAIDDLNNNLLKEIAELKAEMREKIANVKVVSDGAEKSQKDSTQASEEYAEKLEEAVGTLNKKLENQSKEVGGLKEELLEAMAQIGIAVSTVPDSQSDLMALREEIARKQDENAAGYYPIQLDRAVDNLNSRLKIEIDNLKAEMLNAISEIKTAPVAAVEHREGAEISDAKVAELSQSVENLNHSMDTRFNAIKDELLGAIAQVGMAVFNAPDQAEEWASVKDEIVRSNEERITAHNEYTERLDDAINAINEQMNDVKEEVLGAISSIAVSDAGSGNAASSASESSVNYDWLAEKLAQKVPAIDYDFMAERVKALLPEDAAAAPASEPAPEGEVQKPAPAADSGEPFEIDYDLLAEKIAIIVPEVDYDELADRIANMIPQADENAIADKVASVIPQTDENQIADKVADAIPLVDYDLIAEKVAEKMLGTDYENLHSHTESTVREEKEIDYDLLAEKVADKTAPVDYDLIAQKCAEQTAPVDYDLIAEKVVDRTATVDYDLIAEKVVDRTATVDYDLIAEKCAARVPHIDYNDFAERVAAATHLMADPVEVDYDLIADKVAEKIALAEADEIEAAIDPVTLAETIAEYLKANPAETPVASEPDYDTLAQKVAEKIPSINYDELVSRIRIATAFTANRGEAETSSEDGAVTSADIPTPEMSVDYDLLAEILVQKVPAVDYDEITERVKVIVENTPVSGAIDYDALAERISMILPEVDYDTIAERVAAVVMPTDSNILANKIAAAIPQADENVIADRIASAMPAINYDLIANRVARILVNEFDVTVDDAGIAKIAQSVSDELDYNKVADQIVEILKAKEMFNDSASASTSKKDTKRASEDEIVIATVPPQNGFNYGPQPAYNYAPQSAYNYVPQPAYNYAPQPAVPQPAPAVPQPAPVATPKPQPAAPQPAPATPQPAAQLPTPAQKFPFGKEKKEKQPPVQRKAPSAKPLPVAESDEEEDLTPRYKRSFQARISQSEEEVKSYYSRLKNALLQYTRVNSQVNQSNDRFSFAGETIAKVGVNGKTLCLYIALNPDEFASTVYHQKYEGDKKMYEKTPMMVKIKSEIGLKRALRLIPLLMEKIGAVAGEKKTVDYVAMYPYKTDEELIEKGLIKEIAPKSEIKF